MKTKKTQWGLAVALACTWFATHVGGGFATGVQLWEFFGAFGMIGLLTITGWGLISSWINYNAMEFARLTDTQNFIQFLVELYKPLPRIGATIMEVLYHPMMIVAISVVLASAGTLGADLFGLPHIVGIIAMIIIVSVIVMYGAEIVRASSTVMSVGIVVAIVLICGVAAIKSPDSIAQIAAKNPANNIPMAVVMMIMYIGVQVTNTVALVSVSDTIKSEKTSRATTGIGFVLNVLMMMFMAFALLTYRETVQGGGLPMLAISKNLGGLFYALYFIMLLLALITTGVGIMVGIVGIVGARVNLIKKNKKLNDLAICMIYIVLAAILANGFGLDVIISKFLPVIGGIAFLAIIIPVCVVAPIKNAKLRKKEA